MTDGETAVELTEQPLQPIVTVTKLLVSMLPLDNPQSWNWGLSVEYRSPGQWVVTTPHRMEPGQVMNRAGEWVSEPLPSARTEDFKAATRMSQQDALRLAWQKAPYVTYGMLNAMEAVEMVLPDGTVREEYMDKWNDLKAERLNAAHKATRTRARHD